VLIEVEKEVKELLTMIRGKIADDVSSEDIYLKVK